MVPWEALAAGIGITCMVALLISIEVNELRKAVKQLRLEISDAKMQIFELRHEHREAANRRTIDPIPWSQVEGTDDAAQN